MWEIIIDLYSCDDSDFDELDDVSWTETDYVY
jgi:hypothetical protein